MDVISRYKRSINMAKAKRQKPSLLEDEDTVMRVAGTLVQQRGKSIRTSAKDTSLSTGTTHTIARRVLQLYPYRLVVVQALTDYDKLVRVDACQRLLPLFTPEKIFVFTDEALFRTDGMVNRWNCRIWDHQRPDDFYAEQGQSSAHVMVWAAMTADHVFGPYFFPATVTAADYAAVISEIFFEELISKYGSATDVWFQQDGAPAHTAVVTKELLRGFFDSRVISHGCDYEWPPRSPDLTPCDFYLWGIVKDMVYANGRLPTVAALSNALLGAFRVIREQKMADAKAAVLSVPQRMEECVALRGAQLCHR